jgi:hypothetical protein
MTLLLCVNGAKDLWAALEPLAALAGLVGRHAGLDLAEAARFARRTGSLRMLLVGLELARAVFGVTLPAEVLAEAREDRRVAPLVAEARARLAAHEPREPGVFEETRFRVRARERLRDRLRYCALKLLTPTHRDCAPELPAPLSFVYYGVRPLRLLGGLLGGRRGRAVI